MNGHPMTGQHGQGRRCAVVGAGWAGLAAAVRAVQAGFEVDMFEMAATAGGRARSVIQQEQTRDNGQHILVGAYVRTLDLMRTVGVDPELTLARVPLALIDGQGHGLKLPPGPAVPSFVRAVVAHRRWSWRERLSLLRHALVWQLSGFRCKADLTVAQWSASLPSAVQRELIEPLCVAALNTPAQDASAVVMLRVLKDALFSGPGSADLLLPRVGLSDVLPGPALEWLRARGASIHRSHRVGHLAPHGRGWLLDGRAFDKVVLACSAREAARLVEAVNPNWAAQAQAFAYEPIITVWLKAPEVRAPGPMLLLQGEPAQFGFDLGQLDPRRAGELTLVISGARHWVDAGQDALRAAVARQLGEHWGTVLPRGWHIAALATEKRATFRCTPGLQRPVALIAPDLWAAGDYIAGPYPATLEGAVRSGENATAAMQS
jgi:hydroxysqualene dehydroxylase